MFYSYKFKIELSFWVYSKDKFVLWWNLKTVQLTLINISKIRQFCVQNDVILNRLQKNSKQRNFRSAVLGSDPPVNAAKKRRKKRPIEDITTVVTRVDMEEVSSSPVNLHHWAAILYLYLI